MTRRENVDALVSSYTLWQIGMSRGSRPLFFDECHADVSFEREEAFAKTTAWFESMKVFLRKMGGGIVNGNFGQVTPATPSATRLMVRMRMASEYTTRGAGIPPAARRWT